MCVPHVPHPYMEMTAPGTCLGAVVRIQSQKDEWHSGRPVREPLPVSLPFSHHLRGENKSRVVGLQLGSTGKACGPQRAWHLEQGPCLLPG